MTPNSNHPDEKMAEDFLKTFYGTAYKFLKPHEVKLNVSMMEEYATLKLHAKSEECERLRKRVAELEHIIDHEINDDEDNFQHCADCDLPDACSDYGCAIENGIKRKNDGVF